MTSLSTNSRFAKHLIRACGFEMVVRHIRTPLTLHSCDSIDLALIEFAHDTHVSLGTVHDRFFAWKDKCKLSKNCLNLKTLRFEQVSTASSSSGVYHFSFRRVPSADIFSCKHRLVPSPIFPLKLMPGSARRTWRVNNFKIEGIGLQRQKSLAVHKKNLKWLSAIELTLAVLPVSIQKSRTVALGVQNSSIMCNISETRFFFQNEQIGASQIHQPNVLRRIQILWTTCLETSSDTFLLGGNPWSNGLEVRLFTF